jgi:hypothetical protein
VRALTLSAGTSIEMAPIASGGAIGRVTGTIGQSSPQVFTPALVTPLCDGDNDRRCTVSDIVRANVKIFGGPSYCRRYPAPPPEP